VEKVGANKGPRRCLGLMNLSRSDCENSEGVLFIEHGAPLRAPAIQL